MRRRNAVAQPPQVAERPQEEVVLGGQAPLGDPIGDEVDVAGLGGCIRRTGLCRGGTAGPSHLLPKGLGEDLGGRTPSKSEASEELGWAGPRVAIVLLIRRHRVSRGREVW